VRGQVVHSKLHRLVVSKYRHTGAAAATADRFSDTPSK